MGGKRGRRETAGGRTKCYMRGKHGHNRDGEDPGPLGGSGAWFAEEWALGATSEGHTRHWGGEPNLRGPIFFVSGALQRPAILFWPNRSQGIWAGEKGGVGPKSHWRDGHAPSSQLGPSVCTLPCTSRWYLHRDRANTSVITGDSSWRQNEFAINMDASYIVSDAGQSTASERERKK